MNLPCAAYPLDLPLQVVLATVALGTEWAARLSPGGSSILSIAKAASGAPSALQILYCVPDSRRHETVGSLPVSPHQETSMTALYQNSSPKPSRTPPSAAAREQPASLWGRLQKALRQFCGSVLRAGPVPEHIAIIMDGNRRFATGRWLAKQEGHAFGYRKVQSHWASHTA